MGVSLPVMGVPGVLGGDGTLTNYIMSLGSWLLDLRFNEASGDLINYGTETVALGTVAGCVQGQAGKTGTQEAYLFDGIDDNISYANALLPNVKALTTRRMAFLTKINSMTTSGRFLQWPGAIIWFNLVSTNGGIEGAIQGSLAHANLVTEDYHLDLIGDWTWVFVDYDDAGVLGLGRKIRIFLATATKPAFLLTPTATNVALSGDVVVPAVPMVIGSDSAVTPTATLDGLMDWALCGAGLWTPASTPDDLSWMEGIRARTF